MRNSTLMTLNIDLTEPVHVRRWWLPEGANAPVCTTRGPLSREERDALATWTARNQKPATAALDDSMATGAEMASNTRGDVSGFNESFDPAEHSVSYLTEQQIADEARDRAAAERVIRIADRLDRTRGRGFRAVRHREEDR